MRLFLKILMATTLVINPMVASAANDQLSRLLPDEKFQSGSEYFLKGRADQEIISVRLLSGASRPGIYHIPEGTKLSTLIAFSGGLAADSDPERVIIQGLDSSRKAEVNLEKILDDSSYDPDLKGNDIVMIAKDEPLFGRDTVQTVTLISSIVGIALSAFIIVDLRQ